MKWFTKCISNYANFNGRARRKEFWMYFLFYSIFAFVVGFVDGILMGITGYSFLVYIYALALMIPTYAVTARRLHDIGKSAYWIFFGFVPIVGAIVLLIFACIDGEPRTNKYGPDPKGRGNNDFICDNPFPDNSNDSYIM